MKFLTLSFCVFLTACSSVEKPIYSKDSASYSFESQNEKYSYYAILSHLLNINNDRYQYTDSEGIKRTDELKSFKELEAIYITAIKPDIENSRYSIKQLKIIMLLAFYAEERNSAALNEYLASDLMPIYQSNPNDFLNALKDTSFLIASNCSRLNAFFTSEENSENKSIFLDTNKILINEILANNSSQCLSAFD
ncbi:MAG: hypothetical protein K6L75_12210 [Cellvibrionaceae bacterium]